MTYPVHERFYSFQGEGVHMGRAAFFIRLFGCPIHCPWCDSAGTWHPDHIPDKVQRLVALDLASEVKESGAEFAVITGGEPTIHNLEPLVREIQAIANVPVHLETSGAFATVAPFDWITLSPKREAKLTLAMLIKADEFKFIVDKPGAALEWVQRIQAAGLDLPNWPDHVWLNPEWSKRGDLGTLAEITQAVKLVTKPRLRAGWQLHKCYRADALDNRSAIPVPLGGDSTKGY